MANDNKYRVGDFPLDFPLDDTVIFRLKDAKEAGVTVAEAVMLWENPWLNIPTPISGD